MTRGNTSDVSIKSLSGLLSDRKFIALADEFSSFNPFKVLKLESHEIRHSNVLAWLFTPTESHGLGSKFLEQFLYGISSCIENKNKNIKQIENAIVNFLTKKNYLVKVKREVKTDSKRFIDLLIECKCTDEQKDSFIILIENKIYSKQSKNQLDDYFYWTKEKYPDFTILPVYLTVDENDEPEGKSKDEYVHLTYFEILGVLKNITQDKSVLNNESYVFILYYIKTIEEFLGMNTKEIEFAREIYKQYRDVINFINDNAFTEIENAGETFVKDYNSRNSEDKIEPLQKKNARFYPFVDSTLKNAKDGKMDDWRNGAICGYFFQLFEDRNTEQGLNGNLYLKIEVGPFTESAKRQKFLNILRENGFEFSKKANENSTYTRLQFKGGQKSKQSSSIKIEDITDSEEISKGMETLFEKTKEMRKKLHKCVNIYMNENIT